jgi:hypothetical protein
MNLFKSIYHHKLFPRFFYKKPDGGNDSGVTGYFLIEWKPLLSIGLLHFKKGSREAFHSHAFNAVSFWIKGKVTEIKHPNNTSLNFSQGFKPKFTPRNNFHKVIAHEDTYCLTFRGPWLDYWYEFKNNKLIILTHGRKVIN